MRRARRTYGAILKAHVALAAVKGNKTVADLSKQFRVHPTQISKWKQQLLARAADVFVDGTTLPSEAPEEGFLVSRGIQSFAGKHVLLLQGPLGPFFRRLSRDLKEAGARVSKINFHGGDWVFYPTGSIRYRGRMENGWGTWKHFWSRGKLMRCLCAAIAGRCIRVSGRLRSVQELKSVSSRKDMFVLITLRWTDPGSTTTPHSLGRVNFIAPSQRVRSFRHALSAWCFGMRLYGRRSTMPQAHYYAPYIPHMSTTVRYRCGRGRSGFEGSGVSTTTM